MLRSNLARALALLASQAAWADLTIRYEYESKIGPAVPAAAGMAGVPGAVYVPDALTVRIKGDKCAASVGPLYLIADVAKDEITALHAASKQFATVPQGVYIDSTLAHRRASSVAPQLNDPILQTLKVEAASRKTGDVTTIQGIRIEDNLEVLSMELPNSTGAPISLRLEVHQWFATDAELSLVPALKNIAACSTGSGVDPDATLQKIFSQFSSTPGSEGIRNLLRTGGKLPLKTHAEVFSSAVLAMLQARAGLAGPANADPKGLLMEFDVSLAQLSADNLPDDLFQVPAGYREVPFEDLLTALVPAGKAPVQPLPDYTGPLAAPGDGVILPQPIFRPEPQYTEEARRAKLSGTVLVSLIVDADGNARSVRIVRSLDAGLDKKAVDAVRTWKFKPAEKNGVPVALAARVEVNFRLLDKPPDPQ